MKTNKIHLLDPLQSQQIAAGEVIERPANIIKELVENSIDAGATIITVALEKAGKKAITITDNGCGMSSIDAQLCFARHATSKLSSVEQLATLDTFGFRGEALASIASIGIVTLTTKQSDEPLLGTKVSYEHGIHIGTTAHACPTGTTIAITDLFAKLPVRKTFLKQDETEWHAIQTVIHGMALTHHHIHFTLIKDGTTVLSAPAVTSLKDRITQLWNHTFSGQLVPVSYAQRGITITGLISRPPYARYGKDLIMFWVNNRLVKNSDITRAITKGYLQALPIGKYPAAFLAINLDKAAVDVNIHPRKEEVRFTHPGVITSCIQEAITATLEHSVTQSLTPKQAPPLSTPPVGQWHKPLPSQPFALEPIMPPLPLITPSATKPIQQQQQPIAQTEIQADIPSSFTIIGQLFKTYILIESGQDLIMIDQHAAHERILYHLYTTRFTGKEGTQLLFPESITLGSPALLKALMQSYDFFTDQGITFSQTGPHHIMVTSAPPQLQKEGIATLINEAADFIATHAMLDTTVFRQKLNEHVHSHLSCKMAVKAGDILDTPAMHQLVMQLLETPNRFMCVHGRPTMWHISRSECEKQFKRR